MPAVTRFRQILPTLGFSLRPEREFPPRKRSWFEARNGEPSGCLESCEVDLQ